MTDITGKIIDLDATDESAPARDLHYVIHRTPDLGPVEVALRQAGRAVGETYFDVQDGVPMLLVFPRYDDEPDIQWEQPTIIDLRTGAVTQEARRVAE